MGKLYIVATPIGNIEDITLRAIRILKEVDLILCENVSESHRLLKHYDIQTATTNYYSNSRLDKIDKIIKMLEDGKNLALISDAGTPCVSDPGSLLVQKIYEYNATPSTLRTSGHLPEGRIKMQMLPVGELSDRTEGVNFIEIITIPGPSAITALYSISGVTGNSFSFYGFIPQKKGRQTFIKNILSKSKEDDIPIIFYESVHRFEKLLIEIEKEIAYSEENKNLNNIKNVEFKNNKNKKEKPVTINNYELIIGRELTKIYEEIIRGNILEIKEYFQNNKDKIRGEFVIIIRYIDKSNKTAKAEF